MGNIKICIALVCLFSFSDLPAQKSYRDSLQAYIGDYVNGHEVVKDGDKKYFRFFPIDETYRITANFERAKDSKWFLVETSGTQRKTFRIYGTVSFRLHDTAVKLNLYQAQNLLADPKHSDHLVLMFTDKTTGNETYDAGRYLDFVIRDIKNDRLIIDFNKAYNPYCAYVKNKYNCPVPPRENDLPVAIRAGEKTYGKKAE